MQKIAVNGHLSGVLRQKINDKGDLYYKGVVHFFDGNLPFIAELVPTGKMLKGEHLYHLFTYMPWYRLEMDNLSDTEHKLLKQLERSRTTAETKVKNILKKIGVIYYREQSRYAKKIRKAKEKKPKGQGKLLPKDS